MGAHDQIIELRERMGRSIIGQEHIVERLVIALLANGNVLVEGLPGLAKTRAVKSLSKHLATDFSRIQFTPDLLPSDVTGTEVYYQTDGRGEFRFDPGLARSVETARQRLTRPRRRLPGTDLVGLNPSGMVALAAMVLMLSSMASAGC